MSSKKQIKATRFVQNGRVFYSAVVPAGELIEITKADTWKTDDQGVTRGYQRVPSRARVRGIARYLMTDDSVMPVGGLANSRSELADDWGKNLSFIPFSGQSGNIQQGTLEIDEGLLPFWTVDMQHRIEGFREAIENMGAEYLKGYPITITISDGMTRLEEIKQFELINTKQKKIDTALARQLLAEQYSEGGIGMIDERLTWQARGAIVANELRKIDSVFNGKILPPNATRADYPDGITKEASFVKSLKWLLTTSLADRKNEAELAQIVADYWAAVARVWPEAVDNPKDNLLFLGVGVSSLNRVLPYVIELVRERGQALTADSFYNVISDWEFEPGENFWDRDADGVVQYGSSESAFAKISDLLKAELPER